MLLVNGRSRVGGLEAFIQAAFNCGVSSCGRDDVEYAGWEDVLVVRHNIGGKQCGAPTLVRFWRSHNVSNSRSVRALQCASDETASRLCSG
jgi:hypothetical protein